MTIIQYCVDYTELIEKVKSQTLQYNARTGQYITHLQEGAILQIDLLTNKLPIPSNRVYNPKVAAAEAAWILSGDESIIWLKQHTKIWDKFAVNNEIKKSYGYRLKSAKGHQLLKVVNQLKDDSSTRRAVINLWDEIHDNNTSKNAPCPTQIILNCVDNFVNMQVLLRSSDVYVGLPYDVMTWSLILDAIASQLNKQARFITFFIAHPHMYETHKQFKTAGNHIHDINLPNKSITEILKSKNEYVHYFENKLQILYPLEKYNPRPEVYE